MDAVDASCRDAALPIHKNVCIIRAKKVLAFVCSATLQESTYRKAIYGNVLRAKGCTKNAHHYASTNRIF